MVVYTGEQKEAGTDTTINFNLYGDHGDIGHRPLMDSKTNAEPYQPGQMDVFIVEAVSVGKLQKVELLHSGQERGNNMIKFLLEGICVMMFWNSAEEKQNLWAKKVPLSLFQGLVSWSILSAE